MADFCRLAKYYYFLLYCVELNQVGCQHCWGSDGGGHGGVGGHGGGAGQHGVVSRHAGGGRHGASDGHGGEHCAVYASMQHVNPTS